MTAAVRIEPVDPYDDTSMYNLHAVLDEADRHERPYSMTYTLPEMSVMYRAPAVAYAEAAWVAYEDGVPVGVLETTRPLLDNLSMLHASIAVLPNARRRGVGSELARRAVDFAREHRRTTLSSWVAGAPTDASGRRLSDEPRPGEAFASTWGLTNRLADLHRVLDLPVPLERLQELADQTAPYASDYRVVRWTVCPPAYVAEYCALRSSIVSEAPMGDMEMEDEAWDEDRLRTDENMLEQMQRTGYTTAAVAPDGRLAGHTQLVVAGTEPGRIYQWDTLVVPEHRGHRLGLALKAANLRWVQDEHPDRTQVHTFNAAENDPMGSVNNALGFRAVELMGEWQGPVPA